MTMTCPVPQQYYRTESRESAASMLPRADREENGSEAGGKQGLSREGSNLWLAVGIIFILALQIACTTGLFVYFSVSISKLKTHTQGMSEELRCLQIINKMEDLSDPVDYDLDGLIPNESCKKLTNSIKSYINQVTGNILQRTAVKEARRSFINISETQSHRGEYIKSSAHLTLKQGSPLGPPGDLQFQSCRNPIRQWELKNALSHMQNMTYHDGHIKILQDGLYYVYSQIYFRYTKHQGSGTSSGQQLVQCINKKTSYVNPILLLKGVGTKCWAPNAEYGLHSVHQGGVFELRSGDELFVSVSSLDTVYTDSTSNFFGAFKLSM
ncbi:hypothetical protein XELAEV_18038507mg [Xenopus laevis]|uniref:Tumor necrosis factor ligand superfamily member 10 n=1 Tax=Xenopus laevis TaxID=8355 RepID=A0A974C640_XENLA|nr:hypothetical protein XELAEV_18038507mg [Xenopus laevis]